MKQFLVFFFLILYFNLLAQSTTPVSPTSAAKEADVKAPAKSADLKTVDVKTSPKTGEVKITEAKTPPKPEIPVKKELPPLQKEGGFLVLHGLKWQAENISKKSYVIGKETCEKDGMRLPTRDELIDAYFSKYPEFRTPGGYYLSSKRRASDRSMVWYVNFDNGHHNHGPLTKEYNVRCVKVEPKSELPAKTEMPAETKK